MVWWPFAVVGRERSWPLVPPVPALTDGSDDFEVDAEGGGGGGMLPGA